MPRALTLFIAALVSAAIALPAAAVTPPVPEVSVGDVATAAAVDPADSGAVTLLVKVRRGVDRAAVHRGAGVQVRNRIPGIGVDVVSVSRSNVAEAVTAYRRSSNVEYVEPNRVVRVTATPNDEFIGSQYALSKIRAFRGWSEYGHLWRRRWGAPIAVVDSGIDMFHPDLAAKVTHCRSFLTGTGTGVAGCQDSQFHGTHVSGIAAAIANNEQGIAGVAFDSPIMALQVINSTGYGLTADVAAAMVYAARNGAKVANYSFSAEGTSRAERDAVAYAASRRVVQVGAAGNTGAYGVEYPAALPQVIAVAATNRHDRRASYSTYGPEVDVAAPGTRVLSTMPGGALYERLDGTSMAAPHVAGLAALLREEGYGPQRTRELILRRARDLGPDGRDSKFGWGRIDVARSLP